VTDLLKGSSRLKKLKIVKIGGNIIDDQAKLDQILTSFSSIRGRKILVHGGGKTATKLMIRLGIEPQLVEGRRITDLDSLKIVQMVYAGLLNKNIVAMLQDLKCPSLGLSGADGGVILAKKRKVNKIDYGYVGDIVRIEVSVLQNILSNGLTPVFCALTHDGQGQMLNTNADTIASELGIALSKMYQVQLIYCLEENGVLLDLNDNSSTIDNLFPIQYHHLKNESSISKGMIPKVDNAFHALRRGVQAVFIAHYSSLKELSQSHSIKNATQISLAE
jgi:acetylglutamate kinase